MWKPTCGKHSPIYINKIYKKRNWTKKGYKMDWFEVVILILIVLEIMKKKKK